MTTHDVFSVASEAVSVVRVLAGAPKWSRRIREMLLSSIAELPQLLAGDTVRNNRFEQTIVLFYYYI